MRALCCATVIAVVNAHAAVAQTRTGAIQLQGATIPYEIRGTGAPVVFIHGYTQNMSIWDEQVPAFSAKYRVIRYDVRGFGRSTGDVDPTINAADLATLLDTLDRKSV